MKGILLDENNDIEVVGREMLIGDITRQVINSVLLACQGEYKEEPLIGVGLINYVNGSDATFLTGRIKTQLGALGIKTRKITIKDGLINVEI